MKKVFISRVAKGMYQKRIRRENKQLEDWLKAEKIVNRTIAAFLYLIFGFVLLIWSRSTQIILLSDIFVGYHVLLWCIGFSSIGIAAGLFNTRDHDYGNWFFQHVLYCGFVLTVISVLSFVVALCISGCRTGVKFYSLSALVGLIGGFLGDILRPLALKLLHLAQK